MEIFTHPVLIQLGMLLICVLLEGFCELLGWSSLRRARNVCFATLGVIGAVCSAVHSGMNARYLEFGHGGGPGWFIEYASFDGAETFSVCASSLYLLGVVLVPNHVLSSVRFSTILLAQVLVLLVAHIHVVEHMLLLFSAVILLLIVLNRWDVQSVRGDVRGQLRERVFLLYKGAAMLFLCVCAGIRMVKSHASPELLSVLGTLDAVSLFLCSSLLIGLFPFHGWVVPFFGAPRNTIFLPLICLETAVLVFFRLYVPLVERFHESTSLFLMMPVLGLLYSSLLFFGEERLKRIPGYLYLSHISVMALSAIGLGHGGVTASMLDSVNVMLASVGLLAVTSLLSARLGIWAVARPAGLAATFPELGVCYLICTLSLVGFPGTLGFAEEEVMLGQGVSEHLGLVVLIAVGLTLNGFSAFRLFARLFYGQTILAPDPAMAITWREKTALLTIIIFIVINGVAPSFLVGVFSSLEHAMHS